MQDSQQDAFIHEKRMKFQVEFPDNEILFPGSLTPLDVIFYTYAWKIYKKTITKKFKYDRFIYLHF